MQEDINKENLNEYVLKSSCINIYTVWGFSEYKTKFLNKEVQIIYHFLYNVCGNVWCVYIIHN